MYFISPQVETGTQSILVKAPADQAADVLRAMQLVRARVLWSTRPGVTIPVIAVTRISGQFFAFVAQQDNGKLVARQRPLELGEITDARRLYARKKWATIDVTRRSIEETAAAILQMLTVKREQRMQAQ